MPRIIPSITLHIITRRLALYNRMLCLQSLAHIYYQTPGHTLRMLLGVIPSIRPHIRPGIIVSHLISDLVSDQDSVTPHTMSRISRRTRPCIIQPMRSITLMACKILLFLLLLHHSPQIVRYHTSYHTTAQTNAHSKSRITPRV